jgi:CBS-domain-containing membrane protein
VTSQKPFFNPDFVSLQDSDTVGEAMRRMLDHRVTDLPVVDAHGKLAGMFRLNRLLEKLLPRAATLSYGMPDLAFVGDTLDDLVQRMGTWAAHSVRDFLVDPEHTVRPGTSPTEVVLLLYKGANSIPVVDDDGRLVAVVTARDVLAALSR